MEDGKRRLPAVERPAGPRADRAAYGSDVVADALRALGIPYVALNPGASFRGLHDSLVNHLGNDDPQMLLCLHEEHAVAIAQGYAKVTGQMMAAAVHANVGLMHATMAIFDAWCDRMPVLVLGATGPVDAAARRPWIDWIHTARDQAALVRPYVKWDDQPASPRAAQEALARAAWIAGTAPCGPVYVTLDAGLQEAPLDGPAPAYDFARHRPAVAAGAPAEALDALAGAIAAAERPLFLYGRVSRSQAGWAGRVALAERAGARVLTDLKVGAAFPTGHPLHGAPAGMFPDPAALELVRQADLVVSFDWVDLAGLLSAAGPGAAPRVAQVTLDHVLHNGWSMDHQGLPGVDLFLAAPPEPVVSGLLDRLPAGEPAPWGPPNPAAAPLPEPWEEGALTAADLACGLRVALKGRAVTLAHVTLTWDARWWLFDHPLDYIGTEGGGGIGAGPGVAVGAALALRDSGRMPVAVLGDGDFLMGVTALWTAVRYGLPLLVVVANNRSFFNDEIHQERVALARGRPVENRWIGQKITGPEPDLAQMARAQGAAGFGPAATAEEMHAAFASAIAVVEAGGVAVVDVRIEPPGPAGAAGDGAPGPGRG